MLQKTDNKFNKLAMTRMKRQNIAMCLGNRILINTEHNSTLLERIRISNTVKKAMEIINSENIDQTTSKEETQNNNSLEMGSLTTKMEEFNNRHLKAAISTLRKHLSNSYFKIETKRKIS